MFNKHSRLCSIDVFSFFGDKTNIVTTCPGGSHTFAIFSSNDLCGFLLCRILLTIKISSNEKCKSSSLLRAIKVSVERIKLFERWPKSLKQDGKYVFNKVKIIKYFNSVFYYGINRRNFLVARFLSRKNVSVFVKSLTFARQLNIITINESPKFKCFYTLMFYISINMSF